MAKLRQSSISLFTTSYPLAGLVVECRDLLAMVEREEGYLATERNGTEDLPGVLMRIRGVSSHVRYFITWRRYLDEFSRFCLILHTTLFIIHKDLNRRENRQVSTKSDIADI
jgi:hypothetical protein